MRARRASLLTAALAATVLTVSACGSATTGSGSVIDAVKVAGTDAAAAPTVTLDKKPLKATSSVAKVLKEGTGAEIGKTDIASVNALIVNGTSGATVDSTWETKTPVGIDLSQEALFPALKTTLPGKKVGSRILVVAPPKDVFGADGNSGVGLKGTDTVVFVIDVLGATKALAQAKGAAVEAKPELPKVEFKSPTEPSVVTMPSGVNPPAELVVQPLVQGEGAEVKDGQTLRVNYTGVLWKDGSVFDASSKRSPGTFDFPLGQGKVITGWDKGLKGQKVGSRVLLVVPPKEGYGDQGSGTITGTDTIVFVVDILAAY